jgi:hypothetical protein
MKSINFIVGAALSFPSIFWFGAGSRRRGGISAGSCSAHFMFVLTAGMFPIAVFLFVFRELTLQLVDAAVDARVSAFLRVMSDEHVAMLTIISTCMASLALSKTTSIS